MGSGLDAICGDVPMREIVDCTCFRLRRAARAASQIYDHALAPVDLTVAQFGLLAVLFALQWGADGVALGLLADGAGMDPTTLNRNLKPLEARGLVESQPDPNDRRVRAIRLTEAGRSRLAEAAPLWKSARDRLRSAVGAETLVAINGLLDLAHQKLHG